MSSGRSHSDADLEALANHPIPPQFNDPGFTRQSWLCAGGHGAACRDQPVGAGLPAMAVSQSIHPAMTLRHREASSLLQMLLSPLLCGSWLASDGGGSVNTSGADITPSRGKLAPTNAAITPPLWELACQRWRWVSQYIRR